MDVQEEWLLPTHQGSKQGEAAGVGKRVCDEATIAGFRDVIFTGETSVQLEVH